MVNNKWTSWAISSEFVLLQKKKCPFSTSSFSYSLEYDGSSSEVEFFMSSSQRGDPGTTIIGISL